MGYGFYFAGRGDPEGRHKEGRPAGYYVLATCDKRGCGAEIDRGLGYLCGESPGEPNWDDGPGCHRYFCDEHQRSTTPHGCYHRQRRSWGRTLSDMVPSPPDAHGFVTYCCDPTGHDGLHAWERIDPDDGVQGDSGLVERLR